MLRHIMAVCDPPARALLRCAAGSYTHRRWLHRPAQIPDSIPKTDYYVTGVPQAEIDSKQQLSGAPISDYAMPTCLPWV